MANIITDGKGYHGTLALQTACKQFEARWREKDDRSSMVADEDSLAVDELYQRALSDNGRQQQVGREQAPKRTRNTPPPPAGEYPRRTPDGKQWCTQMEDRVLGRLCGAFQGRKGCKNRVNGQNKCINGYHGCAVKLADGPCGDKSHGAFGHKAGR